MLVTGLFHCAIKTNDLKATVGFYTKVLGLREVARPDFGYPGAWLACPAPGGDAIVHIYAGGPALGREGKAPSGTGAIDHLSLAAHGFHEFRERFRAADLDWREFLVPGTTLWQLFVYDPSGVQLELTFDGSVEAGPPPDMRDRRRYVAGVLVVAAGSLGPVTAQGGKVAMLLPGSINDQSWNAAGYGGLQKLKEQGMETAYSENVQAADHIEAMKDYARRGFSPVIGHSGRFLSAAQRVGPEFEKTLFVVGSGSGGQGENVVSLDLANEQFGYLAGALAARMSKTGKIGAVAGLEGLPNMVASMGGFRLGAKSVRPDVEVRIVYLQSMEDLAAAKEASFSRIGAGAVAVR